MVKLNVYEYTIKDSKLGNYKGSYTVIAGCPNEPILKEKLHSKLVDTFYNTYRKVVAPRSEKKVYLLK